ncbi:MAG: hypothetical protein ACRENU_12540 [Gemmatimonadaceae bacterium]
MIRAVANCGQRAGGSRAKCEAADALRAIQEQFAAMSPSVENDAAVALRAAQMAYTEGEVPRST